MKTSIRVLTFALAVLLLCPAFAGCARLKSNRLNRDMTGLKLEDTFEDGKPYHLYFKSNGDGTCKLYTVTIDPNYEGKIVLEIPEESPLGDKVVEIDVNVYATQAAKRPEYMPIFVTKQRLDVWKEAARENGLSEKEIKEYLGCYTSPIRDIYDVENQGGLSYEEMECFPFELNDNLYKLAPFTSAKGAEDIYKVLVEYANFDQAEYEECCAEILEIASNLNTREEAEIFLAAQRYVNRRMISGIVIPTTVTEINTGMWRNLCWLQTVEVDPEHPQLCMKDGCLINYKTKTLIQCAQGGAMVPEGVEVLATGAFLMCGNLTGSLVNVQKVMEIPEGVTTLAPDCLAASFEWRKISLPTSLRYLGEQPGCYIKVLEYRGTLQEFKDNVTLESKVGVYATDGYELIEPKT